MKYFVAILFSVVFMGCNQQNDQGQNPQATIDSLTHQLSGTYKPGLGEFMSGIQTHHAKLWFAGINENWPLADFEVHEIEEAFDDIQKFCSDRPEIKSLSMINPAIDSVSGSIREKNLASFKNNFTFLTGSCNNCHKSTDHAFNVVIIPQNPPVVNQEFKPLQ